MARSTTRKTRLDQITADFKAYLVSNETAATNVWSRTDLEAADEDLGPRDAGEPYRLAIRYRIKELELAESVAAENKVADLEVQGTLQSIEKQLRIMNMYLSNMTNLHFDKEDLI